MPRAPESPVSRITAALATLDARTRITRGAPADPEWIAERERAAKTTFCPAYVAFLKEHGALRLETDGLDDWHADLVFPGHAPGAPDLALDVALTWLHDTFERWHAEPKPGAPVVMYGDGSGWPDALVTADAKMFGFHRNQLHDQQGDFVDAVLGKIAAIRAGLAEGEATSEVRTTLLAACVHHAPEAWKATYVAGSATFVRPKDGVEITVRLGDGRELHGSGHQGVFVSWFEDTARDLEALNEWNARAAFVRASRDGMRSRHRGMLPVTGLDAHLLLALVAHDAELPLELPPRPVPTLEELQTALVAPPSERALFARRWRVRDVRVDAEGLVMAVDPPGGLLLSDDLGPSPEVRVRARADGLVEMVHRSPVTSRADALAGLEQVNRNVLGDNNLDLEPCVRGVLEAGDTAALSIVTAFGAVSTPAFLTQAAALSRAVRQATFLARPDPMDAVCRAHEARLGRPVGPHLRAMLEYIHDRSLALVEKSRRDRRFRSPWGTLVEFGSRSTDEGASFAGHVDPLSVSLALAVDHGTSSDDCPVIGIDTTRHDAPSWPARVLAKDLASFVSVLLLRTTGFDFDGDSDYAWRSYRSFCREGRFGSPRPEVELAARLGVTPARDIGGVQAEARSKLAPLPGAAEVAS